MSNSLIKALSNSQRSYLSAKASVAENTSSIMASAPNGVPGMGNHNLPQAQEQLRHFRGWVYASIRPIAQKIAGQPIHVGKLKHSARQTTKKFQPTDVEPFESHPLLDLLCNPNDLMVAWSLMFSTVASLEMTGRQLWWLPDKKQILPIPTSWIQGFEGSTSFTAFKIRTPYSAEEFPIPADECVYFNYPHPGDPHGAISPLQAVGAAVDADEAIQHSQVNMFRKGIHPSHAVLVGKRPHPDVQGGLRPRLSDAQQRQIIGAIRKRYAGVDTHGEPLILDGLIEDVKKLSNTPAEMDWLNSGKDTKSRIMQGFGVNPIIAGELEGANRASATVADKHFIDYCVNPKIELLSQVLTEWLRPMFGDDLVVWIEPCTANDADIKLKWAAMLARHSAVTGDELRELSPFDLELGNFSAPVVSNARNDSQIEDDPALFEASRSLNSAMDLLKDEFDQQQKTWQVERLNGFELNGNGNGKKVESQ